MGRENGTLDRKWYSRCTGTTRRQERIKEGEPPLADSTRVQIEKRLNGLSDEVCRTALVAGGRKAGLVLWPNHMPDVCHSRQHHHNDDGDIASTGEL